MPIGGGKKPAGLSAIRGTVTANTTVKRDGQTSKIEAEHYTAPAIVPAGEELARVTVGHEVTMAINFQSAKTVVVVSLPCRADPESIEKTKRAGFALVETYCSERAEWVRDVLAVMNEAKKAGES